MLLLFSAPRDIRRHPYAHVLFVLLSIRSLLSLTFAFSCGGCTCQKSIVSCVSPDSLGSFPFLGEGIQFNITEIIIRNQSNITLINDDIMKNFPNLVHLSVESCGVELVTPDAFQSTPRLKRISFRGNRLTSISWKTFENLKDLKEIILEKNTFFCNCSAAWIERRPELFPHPVMCLDEDNRSRSLDHLLSDECPLPSVRIVPSFIDSVREGDDVTLTCQVQVSSPTLIRWIGDYNFSSGREERLEGTHLYLVLKGLRSSGSLRCIAENVVGKKEATASILVLGAPRVEQLEQCHRFHLGLCYRVTGHPTPKRHWLFNGIPLNTSLRMSDTYSQNVSLVEGHLAIEQPTYDLQGEYTLMAVNSLGNDSLSVFLFVELAPSQPPNYRSFPGHPGSLSTPSSDLNFLIAAPLAKNALIITGTMAGLVGVLSCAGLACYWRRRYRVPSSHSHSAACFSLTGFHPSFRRKAIRMNGFHGTLPLNPSHLVANPHYSSPCLSRIVKTISKERIFLMRTLGEGAFGRVYHGVVKGLVSREPSSSVAVKMLKDMSGGWEEFVREAQLLTSLRHGNIVRFHGICLDSDPVMMIFEYMEHGDLNNYLRSHGTDAIYLTEHSRITPPTQLTHRQALRIAEQIAAGCDYLATHRFVHRDLATRNCLVGKHLVIKIGDFGMSRDVYSTDYYRVRGHSLLPVRWMPPESIMYRKFTIQTDVWSFGVVLWEIFTFGKQPWFDLSNCEVIQHITSGQILSRPPDCPQEVYKLMMSCWKRDPDDRISFKEILRRLRHMAANTPNYLVLLE